MRQINDKKLHQLVPVVAYYLQSHRKEVTAKSALIYQR